MTNIELLGLLLGLLTPLIALLIFLAKFFINLNTRMATVETNVKLLLQWVACLNGDMKSEKEFQNFLKKLKKVNKENLCD